MDNFWRKRPAFLFGLTLFLGVHFALQSFLALIPLVAILSTSPKKAFFALCVVFLFPSIYFYHSHDSLESGEIVEGTFTIQSLVDSNRFGHKMWGYRGQMRWNGKKIPAQFYSTKFYSPSKRYHLRAKATPGRGNNYALKLIGTPQPLEGRWTLAWQRYRAKKIVDEVISKRVTPPRSAQFLIAMATGHIEDRALLGEFNKLGISHILAISGFHFALMTLTLHAILRRFLPPKPEALLLMGLITLYFLFLGASPSIHRAWLASVVVLLGIVCEKQVQPVNTLGLALIGAIVLDPLSPLTLSFQLSFLATVGILFYFQPVDKVLALWIPKGPFSGIRKALAVTGAVHLTLLPLLLFSFHTFSLSTLFYNVFFPFCAGIALLLLLVSFLVPPVHLLNGWFCRALLSLSEHPPLLLKPLYLEHLSPWVIVLYLTGLLWIGVKVEKRSDSLCIPYLT